MLLQPSLEGRTNATPPGLRMLSLALQIAQSRSYLEPLGRKVSIMYIPGALDSDTFAFQRRQKRHAVLQSQTTEAQVGRKDLEFATKGHWVFKFKVDPFLRQACMLRSPAWMMRCLVPAVTNGTACLAA